MKNKKTIILLAALGVIHAKKVLAQDVSSTLGNESNDPAVVAESLDIHPETIRVLKMFLDLGALGYDEKTGVVFINPSNLPEFVIEALDSSSEAVFDEETQLYILDDRFVEALAATHSFSRLANSDATVINIKIMERLKRDLSPILREDLKIYSKSSFMAGF